MEVCAEASGDMVLGSAGGSYQVSLAWGFALGVKLLSGSCHRFLKP